MDREDLVEDLNDHYSKKTLTSLLNFMDIIDIEKLNKPELIDFVINSLNEKELFLKLYNKLSFSAKLVLNHLTWDGISTIKYMDSKYHIKLSLEDFYDNTNDPFIKQFKQYNSREILLSTGLRDLFKKNIDGKFPILESHEFDNDDILYSDSLVIDNLSGILEFIKSNNIQFRELSKKLLKKTINKFSVLYNLNEPLECLRIEFILRFLSFGEINEEPLEILSTMVKQYINGRLDDFENLDRHLYYPFVKGFNTTHSIDIFLKRGRFSFLNRIKKLNGWISIESLVREQSLLESTQIFDTTYFGSILHVKVPEEFSRNHSTKIYLIQKNDNELLLLSPMCRGIIFFLYSFGAADIIFNTNMKEFGLYELESITHFKLTELGKRLLGLKSTYELKTKKESVCKFNDKRTIVYVTGEDSGIFNFFENISTSMSGGYYILSFETFFKNCENESDTEYKIDRLTTLLGLNPPEIWSNFLSGLTDRINPTYNEQELTVINFPQDNEEFIDLIMDDEGLRSLFYIVEGFKGAFTSKNYKEFKRSLKEKGYIIN